MEATRWQDLFMHLQNKGVDVYAPQQHVGDCLSPFVVVKDGLGAKLGDYSTQYAVYDFLCYVPQDSYSTLEQFTDGVKANVLELKSRFMIRDPYIMTASFYDETSKSHMKSFQMVMYKKINLT